jgi:hypothetical protein
MQYLVLHDKGAFSAISVETEGKVHSHAIKCWALNDGKRMEFVHMRMAAMLSKYYVSGTYQQMALYALSFDELHLILTNRMGLDDEARYLEALNCKPPEPEFERSRKVQWIVYGGEFLIKLVWGIVKLLGWVILIPFIINFFRSRK